MCRFFLAYEYLCKDLKDIIEYLCISMYIIGKGGSL